jgi:hypothetical protein
MGAINHSHAEAGVGCFGAWMGGPLSARLELQFVGKRLGGRAGTEEA